MPRLDFKCAACNGTKFPSTDVVSLTNNMTNAGAVTDQLKYLHYKSEPDKEMGGNEDASPQNFPACVFRLPNYRRCQN